MARAKYICNVKKPSSHCNVYCIHGVPHFKERNVDANCEKLTELCGLSEAKREVRVNCRKIGIREMKKKGFI